MRVERKKRIALRPEQWEDIRVRYNDGKGEKAQNLAAEYGVCVSGLHKQMRALNGKTRSGRVKLSEADIDVAWKLWKWGQGESGRSLAARFKVSDTAMLARLRQRHDEVLESEGQQYMISTVQVATVLRMRIEQIPAAQNGTACDQYSVHWVYRDNYGAHVSEQSRTFSSKAVVGLMIAQELGTHPDLTTVHISMGR